MTVKCIKLPVIQACTAFEGFLPRAFTGKNRVVSRWKNSIFTIGNIVNPTGGFTKNKNPQSCQFCGKATGARDEGGQADAGSVVSDWRVKVDNRRGEVENRCISLLKCGKVRVRVLSKMPQVI